MALTRITKGVIKPNENYDTHNIVSTGIVTSVGLDVNGNADVSGSLSVGGVLTYEDVTSIDSIGIITARTGLVSPYADIDDFVSVGSNIHLGNAGVITATSFVGSGAALTGIDATAIKDSGGNVKVQAQASGAMYTGIHTFSSGAEVGSNIKLGNAGVITATSFVGSGAALTGIDATAVKDSGGNVKIQAQASGAVYTGIHTFVTLKSTSGTFTGDIDVDGHTNLDNLNIAGVSTFAGTLNASTVSSTTFIASGDLDVDGHTNLDNVSVAGVTTMSGNLTISNTAPVIKLVDTDNNSDFSIYGAAGVFNIYDETNTGSRLTIASDGTITAVQGLVCSSTLTIPDSIIHTDDSNTKIRFPAADQISFETGGSNRLKIHNYSSNNNVEVDASAHLSLADNGSNGRFIYIGDGDASSTGYMHLQPGGGSQGFGGGIRLYSHSNSTNAGGVYIGKSHASSGAIIFGNGGMSPLNEYLRIDSNGRLLVNRTSTYASSSERLSVNGMTSIQYASTSAANLYLFNTDTTGSGTVQPYLYLHDGSGIRGGLGLQYSTSNFIINGQSAIQFRTGSSGVGGTERLRIHSTGQISTNVNNNSYEFTIGGLSGGPTLFLRDSGTSGTPRILFGSSGGALDGGIYYNISSNYMAFYTNGTEHIRIDQPGNLSPVSDASRDLGTSSLRWRNVYTTDLQLSNENTGGNEVDGTEGNWTLQEGESDVYMINRKTGKKYKMMLQEVS